MKRHSTGESTHFNRTAVVKYKIPIDGHVVKALDEDKIASIQMRGGARDPMFEYIPNPAEPTIEPGKPLSFVELMEWVHAASWLTSNKDRAKAISQRESKVKCFFQILVGPKFADIKNIYDVLNNTKHVDTTLHANVAPKGRNWAITTMRGYFATGLWLTSNPKEVAVHLVTPEAKDFYMDYCSESGQLTADIVARAEARTMDPAHSVYKWDMIIDRMKKVYGELSPYVLYLKIFEDFAVRNDLGAVRIVETSADAKKGGNYIVKHDPLKNGALSPYFVLMDFKTDRIYQAVRGNLTPETQKIILDSLEKQPRDYLFCREGSTNEAFGDDLSRVMKTALRNAGLDMKTKELRNAYISYKLPLLTTRAERLALARKFEHSIKTQPNYVRDIQPAITSNTSALLNEHLEAHEGEDTGEVVQKAKRGRPRRPAPVREEDDDGSGSEERIVLKPNRGRPPAPIDDDDGASDTEERIVLKPNRAAAPKAAVAKPRAKAAPKRGLSDAQIPKPRAKPPAAAQKPVAAARKPVGAARKPAAAARKPAAQAQTPPIGAGQSRYGRQRQPNPKFR